jgi:hypothetical protein
VLGGFFAFAGMLEGKSVDQVKEKVESVSLVWNACLRCAEELMKK